MNGNDVEIKVYIIRISGLKLKKVGIYARTAV